MSPVALRGPEPCLAPEQGSRVGSLYLALGPAETDVTGGAQDIRNEGGDAETHDGR